MGRAVRALGGLLSGVGKAYSENAVMQMKENALRSRQENYLRLADKYTQAAEGRAEKRVIGAEGREDVLFKERLTEGRGYAEGQAGIKRGQEITDEATKRQQTISDMAAGWQQQIDILNIAQAKKIELLKIGDKFAQKAASAKSDLERRKLFGDSFSDFSKMLTEANKDILDPSEKLTASQIKEQSTTFAGQVSGLDPTPSVKAVVAGSDLDSLLGKIGAGTGTTLQKSHEDTGGGAPKPASKPGLVAPQTMPQTEVSPVGTTAPPRIVDASEVKRSINIPNGPTVGVLADGKTYVILDPGTKKWRMATQDELNSIEALMAGATGSYQPGQESVMSKIKKGVKIVPDAGQVKPILAR